MSQQIVSTWDGVANTNSWVHDGDVERSAVDIVELASSVAGYSAGAQSAADAASGYADTASAAVASIGTAATDAVAAVQDEGATQISALVDAGGVQSALIGSAGAAQISDIVTSGGVVTSAIADAGAAEIADIVSAGGAQVALVSAAGTSATGDLAAVTAAQSAALVSAGGYQSGLIVTAGGVQIAAVQAEGGTQIAAVQLAASAQVDSATSAAIIATSAANTAETVASGAVAAITSTGAAQVQAVNSAGGIQSAAVVSAGSAQIALVNSAGATQSAAVVSAGGAQITAVNSAGAVQSAAVVSAGSTASALIVSTGNTQSAAIVSAGATQSAAVVSAGGAQITSIGSAGAGQIDAIASAGATQSAAVVSEGGLQVGLVQSAGAAEIEAITGAASDYAKKNGNYPDMTVGNAEQLVSEDYLTDTAPYVFRTAGGNVDIGDREYDELVGGTIAWNQHIPTPTNMPYTSNGITFSLQSDGGIKVSGAVPAGSDPSSYSFYNIPFVANHVYFLAGCPSGGSRTTWFVDTQFNFFETGNGVIAKTSSSRTSGYVRMYVYEEAGAVDFVWYPKYADLTAMFGTAIADYIYALEQATAGAGVAWFRTHFPKNYYSYNAGSLQSVQAASHDMVGFNQLNLDRTAGTLTGSASDNTLQRSFEFDKYYAGLTANNYYNTAYVNSASVDGDSVTIKTLTSVYGIAFPVRVFPQTTYYINMAAKAGTPAIGIGYYDGNGNPIGYKATAANATFETPANCYIATIIVYSSTAQQLVTATDLNLNISWSGYRNGEYEPYQKHSYPLDASLTLRGIPKLDASNNLYYDGDTYEADGTVTRRYGIVDLGTLTWTKQNAATGVYRFYSSALNAKVTATTNTVPNIICTKYNAVTNNQTWTGTTGITLNVSYGSVLITDVNYYDSTATGFKAAMSGVYIIYELATPTTETADAYQTPQIVNDFGTEQYVDAAVAAGTRDVAIPVGHDTRYMSNLKDKLRRLPNIPDNAGTYLVYYDGATRRMSCTEYLDGAKVTALEGKVPDAPAEDGTYTLTATVADGEVTYSWVSA